MFLKNALVFCLTLTLPFSLFSQGAIVGYADGNKHVNTNNVTSFPTNAQLDRLTHVIAVGLGVNDPSGTLKTTDLPNFWNGNSNTWVASLVSRAHQRGIKVSICITGESEFNAATETPQKRNAFATQIANFVNNHGLDGIEINWEHPTNSIEWNRCISLLAAIRSALPNNKKISISLWAAHPSQYPAPNPGAHPFPRQVWQIVDAIHIMTYDEAGWPTHSDTTNANNLINNWGNWGVSNGNLCKGELFVGSAFYGWHPVVGVQQGGQRVSYRDYILNNDTTWYSNPGDLPADVTNKAIHTRDNGFGGVFVWELAFDLPADDSQSLLKAIDDVMPSISGPNSVCNSNTIFTLYNPPPGSTVSWSHSSNLTSVLGGNDTLVVQAASSSTSGPGWQGLAQPYPKPSI